MIVVLCAVAATVAVACLYLFLDAFRMRPSVLFSVSGASLLLLWLVVCYLERKRHRQLQRLREGLDRLR
jgi:hypothetical protein